MVYGLPEKKKKKGWFKKKTSEDLAAELKEIKTKRLATQGRAKLQEQIAEEKRKMRSARSNTGFLRFAKEVGKEIESRVDFNPPPRNNVLGGGSMAKEQKKKRYPF